MPGNGVGRLGRGFGASPISSSAPAARSRSCEASRQSSKSGTRPAGRLELRSAPCRTASARAACPRRSLARPGFPAGTDRGGLLGTNTPPDSWPDVMLRCPPNRSGCWPAWRWILDQVVHQRPGQFLLPVVAGHAAQARIALVRLAPRRSAGPGREISRLHGRAMRWRAGRPRSCRFSPPVTRSLPAAIFCIGRFGPE